MYRLYRSELKERQQNGMDYLQRRNVHIKDIMQSSILYSV